MQITLVQPSVKRKRRRRRGRRGCRADLWVEQPEGQLAFCRAVLVEWVKPDWSSFKTERGRRN